MVCICNGPTHFVQLVSVAAGALGLLTLLVPESLFILQAHTTGHDTKACRDGMCWHILVQVDAYSACQILGTMLMMSSVVLGMVPPCS